jgi:hypothetical protein
MNKRSGYKATSLMALAPLAILLFVSCSSTPEKFSLGEETTGQWNAAVEKTIVQPQRAAKLKALGQQLIDVSNSIQQDIGAFNEKAIMLNEKYDASNEELQQLVVEFSEKRNPKVAEYRDIIFAMRSEVSADEWKALTD